MSFHNMLYSGILVVSLLSGSYTSPLKGFSFPAAKHEHRFERWLQIIHKEHSFDTILVAYSNSSLDVRLEGILEFPKPKVLLTSTQGFAYHKLYNSEILVIISMTHKVQDDLTQNAAQTLNFMRHVRIFLVALDVLNQKDFQDISLGLCHKHQMTNVLLIFLYELKEWPSHYYQLKPYPVYHWLRIAKNQTTKDYFPPHWHNMQNVTIRTYSDQSIPKSFLYLDAEGNLKTNGYVARLILLFAQHFNASLQWYKPPKLGEVSHFIAINKLVDDNLIDIPMTMVVSATLGTDEWLHRSYFYQVENARLIVPCAQQLTRKEVFSVLLDVRFFGLIIFCTVLFSLLHSLVDYVFEGIMVTSNVLLSDRVLPAILGQSFVARNSPWSVLKLLYILLSFLGLNISTQFSATMNSLFTSHPYHQQIETMTDIRDSALKMHILKSDLNLMGGTLLPIFRSLITSDNDTQYHEMRLNFNTSTGYFTSSSFWRLLELKQQHFKQKLFCSYENMTVYLLLPWAIHLPPNSPYKKPMDYLVQQVNAMGLVDAWYASTFNDMVKQKKIALFNVNVEDKVQAMTASDLYWTWIILIIGLSMGIAAFLAEHWHNKGTRFSD
ncbi:uncharacterized protein LOC106087518 [Stomoxys calcitrans]|uniref:uncharacterized protein LOC106087518 n=1 Tax=Stomoxys calcitrans TaxID=35570 RepID=UPI0027E28C23|nr:uncharacterized protein LOC106087518 [Stomoxys calcitrans]